MILEQPGSHLTAKGNQDLNNLVTPPPTNDNSNPQQGTGTAPTILKDPGTMEGSSELPSTSFDQLSPSSKLESRKLFVGGLPTDSKFQNEPNISHPLCM
jgi:RNA recognition motif-containing protein